MSRRAGVFLVVLAVVLSPAARAAAGPPGDWTVFTNHSVYNFANHGYVRTGDGVLHVSWWSVGSDGGFEEGLVHTSFNADGTLNRTNQMVTGNTEQPALVLNSNGTMRAFFGMLDNNHSGLATATSSSAVGDSWALSGSDVVSGGAAYASPAGAIRATDGQFFQAYGNYVHRGLSAGSTQYDYQPFGCCAYQPQLAQDQGSGQIYRVWYSNAESMDGLLLQEVTTSSGAPKGSVVEVPEVAENDSDTPEWNGQSSPMTGRPQVTSIPGQAGVYVAYHGGYPNANKVVVWRVGDPEATIVHRADDQDFEVAMSAAPDGRLWVLWAERSTTDDNRIYYRVSDAARTSWSPVAAIARPPDGHDTNTLYSLAANAQNDRVDVFAHISTLNEDNGSTYEGTWHTQIPAPVQGSDGDDSIEGTPEDDVIFAGDGNDTIDGGGGNDIIVGGAGEDAITGGAGKDKIDGGAGNDRILGDVAGSGESGGVAAAQAAAGADKITAGAGNDNVHAGGAKDNVVGGGGKDTMWGDAGNDKLKGDAGNDTLYGGEGVNDFNGGAGKDHCILETKKDKKNLESCEKKTFNFTFNFWPAKEPS